MKKSVTLVISLLLLLSFTAAALGDTSLENAVPVAAEAKDEKSSKNKDMPVTLKAKSAVLMDASSGQILAKMNEHDKVYPASVTKIMPLLLVMEAIDRGELRLLDKVTATKNAAGKGGSQIWLKEGEVMSVDELLKAAAIYSANDATTALGEHLFGSEEAFVDRMNERAVQLGMADSYFENGTGLDDTTQKHLTSAHDIAVMSRELLKYDLIQNYTTVWMDSLRGGETELVNTNKVA